MRRIMTALTLAWALLSIAVSGPPPVGAAPPGHALPFLGTYPILEGPNGTDEDHQRDAEGIIVGLPVRAEVRASQAGTVVFAGWQPRDAGYLGRPLGVVLHLRHDDGTVSEYGYLNDVDVPLGASVERGDFVAHSGMTGETEHPALYFAILIGSDGSGFDGRSVSIRDLPGLDWAQMRATGAGQVLPTTNLAREAAVWATSTDEEEHPPELAVDGDMTTRFSSAHRRQQETIGVLLPGRRVVTRVAVHWEAARPKVWSVWIAEPGADGLPRSREVWRTDEWAGEAEIGAVAAYAVMVRSEDHWEHGWANVSLFEIEIEGF